MADRAAAVDAIFDDSAAETGGERHLRWVTDANCNVDIDAVHVSAADLSLANFSCVPQPSCTTGLVNALEDHGFDRQDRKYLVWVDTGTPLTITNGRCDGVGGMYYDDRADPDRNYSNLYVGYTRVDDTCLFALFDPVAGKVEAHELMHTLGAVQDSAPNATGNSHCRDDYDVMCYDDDGASGPVTVILPYRCPPAAELRLDCQDNDYFSTNPPAGSYLATHWNAANSGWLEAEPGTPQAPDVPRSVTGAPGDHGVSLNWAKPDHDGGEPVLGYQVYRDGRLLTSVTNLSTVGAVATGEVTTTSPSFTDTGLTNGTTYQYRVSAVNAVGEGPRTAAVSVMSGVPRPDAQVALSRAGPFGGDDVYFSSTTGNPQTQTQSVARGGSVTAYVRVQNDRPGFDSLKVRGVAAGASGYTVRYFRGTTDITSAVVAGSYAIENVAPGAYLDLKVKITVTTAATAGSTRSIVVTVKSKTVKTIKDVVQTRARRR
jgi:hypothetical protein